MLRLVQIHGDLLLDDLALLANVRRGEPGVEQHIQQHIEQFVEAVMPGACMETGRLLARKGVQITSDTLDRLRYLPWRSASSCL